jgi:agmatinase
VGIRGGLNNWDDYKNDAKVGFHISHAEDIEEVGYKGIVAAVDEITSIAVANVGWDILALMAQTPLTA